MRPPEESNDGSGSDDGEGGGLRSHTSVKIEEEGGEKKQLLQQIVQSRDVEALRRFGGVTEALAVLPQVIQGTGNDELMELSADLLTQLCHWHFYFVFSKEFWHSYWLSLWNLPILLLIIVIGLSFAIGIIEKGLKHGWYIGGVILIATFLPTFFALIFKFYRKTQDEKKKVKNMSLVSVKRGESLRAVSISEVKEGDIIHLKEGDHAPASGLLISGEECLLVDGVINPNIDPQRNPFLSASSVVMKGSGVMLAVFDGKELILYATSETLLQSILNKPYEIMGMITLVFFILILIVILAVDVVHKDREKDNNIKPANKGNVTMGIMENVLQRIFLQFRWTEISFLGRAVLTVIIGLQHGLPLSIYISLSLWVKRITSHGVKSQNLSASGTMGLVSVICMDITGGGWLSCDNIEIHQFWTGAKKFISGMELHPDVVTGLKLALGDLRFRPKYSVHLRDHLLKFWDDSGLNIHDSSRSNTNLSHTGELVSKSENSEAGLQFHYYGDDAFTTLSRCSHYCDNRGTVHDMKDKKIFFQRVIDDMVVKGLRPIAFARVDTNQHQHFDEGLNLLLGIVGLQYSFTPEIKTAFNDLKDVGVRIVLTSEDELSVPKAMAVSLNLQCGMNLSQMIEGVKFMEMMEGTEKDKNELKNSITVMGKAAPEDKLLLIRELKASGNVVAFFGGLTTTDAQTLREADVGITLENWSCKAAQMNSDLIVAAPTSMIKIISCGRGIYLNIQKYYQAQCTSIISGPLFILVCSIVSGNSALKVVHLLLVFFIMCLLGTPLMLIKFNDEKFKSTAVVVGERDRCLITKPIMMKIAFHALFQALLFSLLEYVGLKFFRPSIEENVRHTFIFNAFILWQICNLLCDMGIVTNKARFVTAALQSPPLFLILLATVLTVLVIVIEFAAKFVNGVKLSVVQWAICFLLAIQRLTMEWLLSSHHYSPPSSLTSLPM